MLVKVPRIVGSGRRNHLFVSSTELAYVSIVGRTIKVIGAVIDMIFYRCIIIRVDRTDIQSRHQMQSQGFGSHNLEAVRSIFPFIIIVDAVISIAAVTFGPRLAGFVISGPIKSPQKVTGLHKVVTARIAGVIITAFLCTGKICIGSKFQKFASLLSQIQATRNTVEAVLLQTSFILGIRQRSIVVGILRGTAHGHIVCLINCRTEVCFIPIVILAAATGIVIFKDTHIFISTRTVRRELITMLIETII